MVTLVTLMKMMMMTFKLLTLTILDTPFFLLETDFAIL